jgi:putative tricarboxylic transport membrane protein
LPAVGAETVPGISSVSSDPIESSVQFEPTTAPDEPWWIRYAELLAALAVVSMGIVILLETRDIRVPRAFTVVGPRDFPQAIGVGFILIGIWYAIDVVRNPPVAPSADSEDADAEAPTDWRVLGQLAVVLALYAGLMESAGFILASAVLFLGTAFTLGSRHFLRDAALGIILSTLSYLLFSEWLGIRLPAGWLDGLL